MGNLEETLKALNKKFGKSYIGTCSEILDKDYKRRSYGISVLDAATGGGSPERKVTMIAGKESSGKTSTALAAIAATQKVGGKAALIDVEHGFDAIWAAKLGVKVDELLIAQSKTIEEVSDTLEPLVMSNELDLIVVDSVAAAPSMKELEESSEQKSMGGKAKVIGLMMGKLTARLNDVSNPVKTSVILLNQIRDNVGGWGAPEYTPGGKQLHFQSDIIIWLRPDSMPVGGKEEPIGITVKFKVTKNRTAPPFKTGTYDLLFEGRFDERKALIELAIKLGIITKVGYKYTFKEKTVTDINPFVESLTEEEWLIIRKELLEKK